MYAVCYTFDVNFNAKYQVSSGSLYAREKVNFSQSLMKPDGFLLINPRIIKIIYL